MIFTTRNFFYHLHVFFSYVGDLIVERIQCFAVLHERFSRFAEGDGFRIVRVHAAFAEGFDGVHVEHRTEFFIGDDFDLLDFVRCTETIEEVDNGDTTGNSRSVDDSRQVHDFLDGGFSRDGNTRATHSHDIVVAGENRIAVGSDCTRSDVEDARQQFCRHLEHVGQHNHHALGGRECRRQSTRIQCAVHSTGSTLFRLHFLYVHRGTEEVLAAMG